MVISPVSIDFVSHVLIAVGQKRSEGIFQVSADADLSYAEIAEYLARIMNVTPHLVVPVDSKEFGNGPEHIPKYTTLDMSRIVENLCVGLPVAWDVIDQLIGDERK